MVSAAFGTAPDGSPVHRAVIERGGSRVALLTWGATVQGFHVDSVPHSLVLGADSVEPYFTGLRHYGAVAGRVANRIGGGRAPLAGRELSLDLNERTGRNTLHGGFQGSSVTNWTLDGADAASCRMSLRMPDGQGGFPGTLDLTATYALDGTGTLVMVLEGRTDAPTFCNLANHAYWTMDGSGDLSNHVFQVNADTYLPVDAHLIPLGDPAPVADTRFDFREARALRRAGDGTIDHNFCLNPGGIACTLRAGGLALEIGTTEPGLQVYDGKGAGLALEPQRWPDAPNHPDYPSIVLMPGETYRQETRFRVTREEA